MTLSKTNSAASIHFDHRTSEDHFSAFVDQIRLKNSESGKMQFVRLLSERHPIYQGRSTNAVTRMRGYIVASFEEMGLPDRALTYVLDILESSFQPYLVAAAAKALRGSKEPQAFASAYLMKAVYNIWQGDQPISFEKYRVEWPLREFTTGLKEIFGTLEWMGAYAKNVIPQLETLLDDLADSINKETKTGLVRTIEAIRSDHREVDLSCCDIDSILSMETSSEKKTYTKVDPSLVLEDHENQEMQWKDFFHGKPTVLAFFYTRCQNPRKCTQTIYNVVDIQKELLNEGLSESVRTAAITYDPKFDTAAALKSYGTSRQFKFGDNHKMFRAPNDFPQLRKALQLGVNFNGSLVNSHRIEIYLFDENGEIIKSFVRNQTEPKKVVQDIKNHINESAKKSGFRHLTGKKIKDIGKAIPTFVLPIIIAFFPKCPMCWIAYLSVFGIASLETIPYSPWIFPTAIVLLIINLIFLFRITKKRNGMIPFAFSCIGTGFLLLIGASGGAWNWALIPGLIFLITGALLNSLNRRYYQKIKLFCTEFYYHRLSKNEVV